MQQAHSVPSGISSWGTQGEFAQQQGVSPAPKRTVLAALVKAQQNCHSQDGRVAHLCCAHARATAVTADHRDRDRQRYPCEGRENPRGEWVARGEKRSGNKQPDRR
ncbi:Hypothetical predicted protein [Pelobates cultripes]|uniref:Uncharacterized protein n=1 Tax=Pelobates cultripes TaxID=61616 RepID=A0AAD1RSM9_PELCU|nr:Hypothetical predicted protein [Pelobates cultripes]